MPNLTGQLNPILDDLDRMCLYAANIAIDEGRQQPVPFKLNQPLRLTDARGFEWIVRVIDMIGKSALLEYEPPDHKPVRNHNVKTVKLKVVIHQAEEGGYWAEVSSIPGCATQGSLSKSC